MQINPRLVPRLPVFLSRRDLGISNLCFSEPPVIVGPDSVKNTVKFSISRKKATDTQSSLCALYRGRNSRNICKLPQRFYQRNSVEVSIIAKSDRLPKFYLATAFMNFYVTGRKSVDNQPFSTTVQRSKNKKKLKKIYYRQTHIQSDEYYRQLSKYFC